MSTLPDRPPAADPAKLDQSGKVEPQQAPVPLLREELNVGSRVVETGVVRVQKHTNIREVAVDEPIVTREVVVERVPINRVIGPSERPEVRQEGDTTVIPVVDETIVIENRLVLREEVRITRVAREARATATVSLRHEDVTVERESAPTHPVAATTQGERHE
jgi:uncharacterized protein (TIGR02271 family)